MSSAEIRNIIMKPLRALEPGEGRTALEIDFGSIEKFLARATDVYNKDRDEFLGCCVEDEKLPKISKKWQQSTRRLARWAETWFMTHSDNDEEQNTALDILDRITKESAMREINLVKHLEWVEKAFPEKTEKIEALRQAEESADLFLCSAIKTQTRFNELYAHGESFVAVEAKAEKEAGEFLSKIYHKFPAGRAFARGSIFPPERVPVGAPVPMEPEAFTRVTYLDPDKLVYDPEVDELVPEKGYVSEDGKIDDQSVVWHPDTMTVDIGFRGEEKVTWNFWKPKDMRDVPDPESWCAEYEFRAYHQWLESQQRGILKRGPDPLVDPWQT